MWAVAEMWGGEDVLILQFAATKRGLPRIAMVGLSTGGANTVVRLESDGQIVRGAAVLSARQKNCAQWTLEPVSKIHLGATEAFDDQSPLVSFARFTTAAGENISLPIGFTDKPSRGRRIYPSPPARSPKADRLKPADVADKT
ncbi:hypothetical protein OKW41_002767 [Paraburkholderia sp. UCT70]|uniref:hypothetical protein n=1 Tax=Paraburkholderia sp. UCT70 TaxID=2991068 RepID=UPI003D1F7F0B